ncbi:MAG TPA: hypothetical protein VMH37_13320 [Candidatus Binataceae bacterium]|nr:hypothetical protein [Candidatus Binataceae bacterium]
MATMILTVIGGREQDLVLAGIAAAGLCGAGLTLPFPGGLPSRPSIANRGSIEVQCDVVKGPLVRQGFLHAGFDTIEKAAVPNIPVPANVVSVTSKPKDQRVLQMADPAADALCGAGLTIAYPDGRSYTGDLSNDAVIQVQCDQSSSAAVLRGFELVWIALGSGPAD